MFRGYQTTTVQRHKTFPLLFTVSGGLGSRLEALHLTSESRSLFLQIRQLQVIRVLVFN